MKDVSGLASISPLFLSNFKSLLQTNHMYASVKSNQILSESLVVLFNCFLGKRQLLQGGDYCG